MSFYLFAYTQGMMQNTSVNKLKNANLITVRVVGTKKHRNIKLMQEKLVLRCAEIPRDALVKICQKYRLTLNWVDGGKLIPGSFWGESEAGLVGHFSSQGEKGEQEDSHAVELAQRNHLGRIC